MAKTRVFSDRVAGCQGGVCLEGIAKVTGRTEERVYSGACRRDSRDDNWTLGTAGRSRVREDGTVVRRGVSERVQRRLDRESGVKREQLMKRVRDFTDSVIFGSRKFIEEWFIYQTPHVVRCLLTALLAIFLASDTGAEITTFDYRVVGVQLEVSPPVLSVPKGIAGSLNVRVGAGADRATSEVGEGAWVEGMLRGPSFPARRVVGRPNQPLLLPPLPVVGDYQLDNIRLVDASGATRLEGSPSSVPVRVFEDVFVSRVISRPLTGAEIRERGIFIDESNFRAVQFEISFALGGGTVTARFPVVAPIFPDPAVQFTDPAREEELIKFAEEMNRQNFADVEFPEELQRAQLDLEVRPMLLRFSGARPPGLPPYTPPPIAGVLIIPGSIGFLNQFFSVQVYVENAAPDGSGLSVADVEASLVLPTGADRVGGTYDAPGDDPLRYARVGPSAQVFATLPIRRPGADGVAGTPDDIGRLFPGEGSQAEFLVEGLREGLHIMDVNLTGTLEGLAAGPVPVSGLAAGSVFVRNPKFALSFTHPRTVRVGEAYTTSVTVLNTGSSAANGATLTLPANALSGTRLEPGQEETIALGDIAPGESRTADFRMRSQRTGFVSFSNFTSGDDVQGFFRFRSGVDERGVELSPDSLAYPDLIKALPAEVFRTANRVIGQALGAAQRGLPPGVIAVDRGTIERRMRELLEASQRLQLGDTPQRVFADLMLDWQGLRAGDPGFDQLLRTTEAGREWREAVWHAAWPAAGDAAPRLSGRAPDFAGLGRGFWAGASSEVALETGFAAGRGRSATADSSAVASAMVYEGVGGDTTAVFMGAPQGDFTWTATAPVVSANLVLLDVRADGTAVRRTWATGPLPADAVLRYSPGFGADVINVDTTGDGFPESTLSPVVATILEPPPRVLAAVQDLSVLYARPGDPNTNTSGFCDTVPKYGDISIPAELRPFYVNYGMLVALLYNKPVTREGVGDPAGYALTNGVRSGAVKLQDGTRVAYLGLEQGVGTFRSRGLVVSGGTDPRDHPLVHETIPLQTVALAGAPLKGRVLRGDNTPGSFLPVTLTYIEHVGADCAEFPVRAVQTLTDAEGRFEFDFVMGGITYRLDAVELTGFSPEVAEILKDAALNPETLRDRLEEIAQLPGVSTRLLEDFGVQDLPAAFTLAQSLDRASFSDSISPTKEGVEQTVVLRFRGRAALLGHVVLPDGVTPAVGVPVTYFPPVNSTETSFTLVTDPDGRFAFLGSPLGAFSLQAESLDRRQLVTLFDVLTEPGGLKDVTLRLVDRGPPPAQVEVSGRVLHPDGRVPAPHARVLLRHESRQSWLATADDNGTFQFPTIPVGKISFVAVDADRRLSTVAGGFAVVAGATNFFSVTLEGIGATAAGRVLWASDRRPVANAIVSGGRELVRSRADGTFLLEDVPTGVGTVVVAGLEADPAHGIPFPRVGRTVTRFQPGDSNFVEVLLPPEASVIGTVANADGAPAAGVEVALSATAGSGGFRVAVTDAAGSYRFENVTLGQWTVAAPAPAAVERTAAPGGGDPLLNDILDLAHAGNPLAMLQPAARRDLVEAVIGLAQQPTAAPASESSDDAEFFLPDEWGYATARLVADGALVRADIRLRRRVDGVAGIVLNPQNTPIGAEVELSGIAPGAAGEPASVIIARTSADPGTGRWSLGASLYVGSEPHPFKFTAYSPFFPRPALFAGQLTSAGPDLSNVVLKFEPVAETTGKLGITVLEASGQPVGADFPIWMNYLGDYEIRTDASGRAETIALPQGGYSIEAGLRRPYAGLVGVVQAEVKPGVATEITLHLLATGDLTVVVQSAAGDPVAGARVRVQQGGFPSLGYDLVTNVNGKAALAGIYTGEYSVKADASSPAQRLYGSADTLVTEVAEAVAVVRLEPTGRVSGRFLRADGTTPVDGAMVSLSGNGAIIYVPTDTRGEFAVEGVGFGAIKVDAVNPVTGLRGRAQTSLAFDGQQVSVLLVEETPGEVTGRVLGADGISAVASAIVSLETMRTPREPARIGLTGQDGRFRFGGISPGRFVLRATTETPSKNSGEALGELVTGQTRVEKDITLSPRGSIIVRVNRPDGTPVFPARVTLNGQFTTDDTGRVVFPDVRVGQAQTITAQSLVVSESRSYAQKSVLLTQPGEVAEVILTLSGVGRVAGIVTLGDGVTPVGSVPVMLNSLAPGQAGASLMQVAGADGRFAFENVGVGRYDVTTTHLGLRGAVSGEISAGGEVDEVRLTIEPAGIVRGRLLEPDGTTPSAGLPVVLRVLPPGQTTGTFFTRVTGADGRFEFDSVKVQPARWELAADAVSFFGQVRRSGTLATNGAIADLGDLVFDDTPLTVRGTVPVEGAASAATTGPFRIEFSEPLDPTSVSPLGIFIANSGGQRLTAPVAVIDGPGGSGSAVVITPALPLAQDSSWQLIALDGVREAAVGGSPVTGPRDLNGLPLAAPVHINFRTADETPPAVAALFPQPNAVQVDPAVVPRLTFNEAIDPASILVRLEGPAGAVAGSAAAVLNNLAVSFLPAQPLALNATYTLTIERIRDVAGNQLADSPLVVKFTTVDTLGPTIAQLRLAGGAVATGGARVSLEAVLAAPDPGARLRLFANGAVVGETATPNNLVLPFTLPASGSVAFAAVAIDAYGNEGPLAALVLNVVANQPPGIVFQQLVPVAGPLLSGGEVTIRVEAVDDSAVADLRASFGGALVTPLQSSTGGPIMLTGSVPATAGPGSVVTAFAVATDNSGLSSGERSLALPVNDGTAPSVTINAPAAGTTYAAGATVDLALLVNDNFGVTEVTVQASGAFSFNETRPLSAQPGGQVINVPIAIPAATPNNGAAFFVNVLARDAAGLTSSQASRQFALEDRLPAAVQSFAPSPGQNVVAATTSVRVTFNRAIDPATVSDSTWRLLDAASAPVAGTRTVSGANTVVLFAPAQPLRFGASYTAVVTSGLRGGNGLAVAPAESAFTVAPFTIDQPAAASEVVEREVVNFRANGPNETGIESVVFVLPNGAEFIAGAAGFQTGITIPSLANLGAPPYVFGARAVVAGVPQSLGSIQLTVRANRAPVAVNDAIIVSPNESTGVAAATALFANDSDPDGDALSLVSFTQPVTGSAASGGPGVITYTPPPNFAGSDTFTYTVGDPYALTATATVTVTVGSNRRPIVPAGSGSAFALRFDGTDDFLRVLDDPALRPAAFTLEAWALPEAFNTNYDVIAIKSSSTGWGDGYGLTTYTDSNAHLFVNHWQGFQAPAPLTAGVWQQVAGTYDGATLRVYHDGVLVTERDVNQPIDHALTDLMLGGQQGLFGWHGSLDEIRFWNRALTPAEIAARRTQAQAGPEENLVARWGFDEGEGLVALSTSTEGHHAAFSPVVEQRPEWQISTAPIAGPGATVAEDSVGAVLTLPGEDPDGNPITASVLMLPLHGRLHQTTDGVTPGAPIFAVPTLVGHPARQLIYVPEANFFGVDVLKYEVRDSQLASLPAAFRLTVTSLPDNPVAVDDAFATQANLPRTTTTVLANDSDPDGDALSVLEFTQPARGAVVSNGDGTFTYTPQPGFFGTDTFTYRVTDGTRSSLSATVTMTVNATNVVTWVNAADGNWNTAANWVPGRVPGANDVAVIDLAGDYVVTLGANAAVFSLALGGSGGTQTLALNGRTLSVAADSSVGVHGRLRVDADGRLSVAAGRAMTVSGVLDWQQGTLNSETRLIVASGAIANLTTASNKFLDGVLENRGTVNYTGTGIRLGRDAANLNARVENAAGATFIAEGEGDFVPNFQSPNYRFENAGTFIKRGVGTTTIMAAAFNNTGECSLESGILQLNQGGSLGGTVTAPGAELRTGGGSFIIPAAAQGNLHTLGLNSSTLTVEEGAALVVTTLDNNFSTLIIENNYALSDLLLRGDGRVTVAAGGTLTVSRLFDWTQGTLAGEGRVIVGAAGVANLTTVNNKFTDGFLENRGRLNYTGGGVRFGRDGANLPARIENAATGTFIVDGEGDFTPNFQSPSYRFDNAGTFIKRGSNTTTLVSGIAYHSTGQVLFESGVLQLNQGGTLGGLMTSSGGRLQTGGGSFVVPANAQLNLETLGIQLGMVTVRPGAVLAVGALDNDGSNLVLEDSRTLPNLTLRGEARVSVASGSALTVSNLLDWSQGTLTSQGRLIVAGGAVANLTTVNNKFLDGVLENRGTVNFTGNGLRFGRDGSNLAARVENTADGTFIIDGEGDVAQNFVSPNYRFENAGTFIKRGAATTTQFASTVPFANSGTVRLEAGGLTIQSSFAQDGILAGTGTVVSSLTNNGTVRPDPTPGGLTIQGTFTQTATGRLELTLRGADPTLGHRSFRVTGAAAWNGTLALSLAFPFSEAQGAVLPVASHASRTGAFSNLERLTDNFGYNFSHALNPTTLDLTVTTKGDVPEILGLPPNIGPGEGWEQWRAAQQARLEGLPFLATGDEDADGLANLVEYGLGGDPLVVTPTDRRPALVWVTFEGWRYPGLRFRRAKASIDLKYLVELSDDLTQWRSNEAGGAVTRVHSIEPDSADDRFEVVTETPVTPARVPRSYLRLRITVESHANLLKAGRRREAKPGNPTH